MKIKQLILFVYLVLFTSCSLDHPTYFIEGDYEADVKIPIKIELYTETKEFKILIPIFKKVDTYKVVKSIVSFDKETGKDEILMYCTHKEKGDLFVAISEDKIILLQNEVVELITNLRPSIEWEFIINKNQ